MSGDIELNPCMNVCHYYDVKFLKIHLIDSIFSLLCYVDLCTTIPKDNWKFDIGNKQAIQQMETNLKQTKIVESGMGIKIQTP